VEFPNSASTAIHQELVENYSGSKILYKHAYYTDFLRFASDDEKEFFVFSSIRNPLDVMISRYRKFETNHGGRFSNVELYRRNRSDGLGISDDLLAKYNFAYEMNSSLANYIQKFYRLPYSSWANLSHHEMDFVIRFENLQEDFSTVLALIGIGQVRSLPRINETKRGITDFDEYYPEFVREHVVSVFGPYMNEWGYDLPESWNYQVTPKMIFFYQIMKKFKNLYFLLQSNRKIRRQARQKDLSWN
jgi:hypothetical protein